MSKVIKTLPKNCKFSTLSQLRAKVETQTVSQEPETPNLKIKQYQYGPLNEAQKAFLDRVIRVDQAGELGANYIYAGQYFVLQHTRPELKDLLKHMWDQEIHHHNTFNKLQVIRRVRPSLLTPVWRAGAFGIGITTALLGKEAAMACTVAVETVIGGHYNDQLRILMNKFQIDAKDLNTGEIINGIESEELNSLKKTIKEFRDDELEHLDTAVENDAEAAVPYWLLTEVIKGTCKLAIWTAERV
ncbi:2-nonaprenyl-3-methyl-6-methoxy-1,4-benzoquinolhydroxylase [Wickerhamomyces ciferrii]|uniref:5-demethoxyubiquinone hydroxylase, mitochondrial n=1 Tax=Wickerhamomyces ciferrii (strain ATCC 14091 / BCRC 22168 / CBS 111 / JCM 3599 / NBRC 0793 / NRRL Y-1031 F-60-10) TaxID=1206466 RepID=K0KJM6_WICCF|nr:2-nonaprenyl-3-methyl-6-methoxy-1,4-benzoquinolhydroxylase [Wickerhamomyces ciferrii]CCH41283.1 2-nonaprenyl-3-methyl-6-methoxy-1,4-benzoquinolhydroxylase [Wickerhamomyces ciferrii]